MGFKYYPTGSTVPSKEVTYVYDVLGRRIEKIAVDHTAPSDVLKTFTRRYAYDGHEVALEYDGNNSLLARYTHSSLRTDDILAADIRQAGIDSKLAESTGTYIFNKDALGTITSIADTSGNLLQRYLYTAFGIIWKIENAEGADITLNPRIRTSYGFTGREADSESGMMYSRARYYEPSIGRFIQQDPHPGSPERPATVTNKFTYVGNNPSNFSDPTGLFFGVGQALMAVHDNTGQFGTAGRIGLALASGQFWIAGSGLTGNFLVERPALNIAVTIAVIMAAAAFTGGAAGAAAGGFFTSATAGAIAGGIAGAIVGGLVGGIGFQATGVGTFWQGFAAGAIAGGLAGAYAGYYASTEGQILSAQLQDEYAWQMTRTCAGNLVYGGMLGLLITALTGPFGLVTAGIGIGGGIYGAGSSSWSGCQ